MHTWETQTVDRYQLYHIDPSDSSITKLLVGTLDDIEVSFIGIHYNGMQRPDIQYFLDNQRAEFQPAFGGEGSEELRLRKEHTSLFQALGQQVPSLCDSLDACLKELASPFGSDLVTARTLESSYYV